MLVCPIMTPKADLREELKGALTATQVSSHPDLHESDLLG